MVRFWVDPTLGKGQLVCSKGTFIKDGMAKIRFGNRAVQAIANAIQTSPRKASKLGDLHLRLSRELQKTLRLPAEGQLHLQQDNGVWRMGPCLGLYVTREKNPSRMFGEQTVLLEDLTRYGRQRGIDVVVLTPGFSEQKRGWRFQPDRNLWEMVDLPMPDIILRRSGRFHEPGKKVTADLNAFQRAGRLHSLPRNSSNKWTFYQAMQKNQQLQRYLPTTIRVSNAVELKTALQRLRDAYLKPINGAQGIAIHRVQLQPGGRVRVTKEERVVPRSADRLSTQFRPETRQVATVLNSESEIQTFWKSIQGQFRKWVLQESVNLLKTTDGRPVDFRWLVQYTDEPKVTGRVARVGKEGAITTNIHTGGTAMDAKVLLDQIPTVDADDMIEDMDELAVAVVEQLRSEFGPFAEVGIDLGIDQNSRVVAFEVNPTPGRRMLRSLSDNVRELSLTTLVEYAIRAAGFSDGK